LRGAATEPANTDERDVGLADVALPGNTDALNGMCAE
jgi:hypothetical protein